MKGKDVTAKEATLVASGDAVLESSATARSEYPGEDEEYYGEEEEGEYEWDYGEEEGEEEEGPLGEALAGDTRNP